MEHEPIGTVDTSTQSIPDQIDEIGQKHQEIEKDLVFAAERVGLTLEQYQRFLELTKSPKSESLSDDERQEVARFYSAIDEHKKNIQLQKQNGPRQQYDRDIPL